MTKKNPIAKALRSPHLKQQVVPDKRGPAPVRREVEEQLEPLPYDPDSLQNEGKYDPNEWKSENGEGPTA